MSPPNMLRRRFRVLAAVVFAGTLSSLAPTALGATCPLPQDIIGDADVAFVGVMTTVDAAGMRATFAVAEVWKGDLPTEVVVTGPTGQRWTDPSMAGARYLVLANVVASGGLQIGDGCNQVSLWDPSMAAARPATAHPPQSEPESQGVPIPLILIAGVVLLVAAVSALAFRSPRKAPE